MYMCVCIVHKMCVMMYVFMYVHMHAYLCICVYVYINVCNDVYIHSQDANRNTPSRFDKTIANACIQQLYIHIYIHMTYPSSIHTLTHANVLGANTYAQKLAKVHLMRS